MVLAFLQYRREPTMEVKTPFEYKGYMVTQVAIPDNPGYLYEYWVGNKKARSISELDTIIAKINKASERSDDD